MKLKRNLRTAALGFALAALATLSPLGIETAHAKTLVYCPETSPLGFDPAPYTDHATYNASAPLYNRLLEFERGTTNVIPGLAESWSFSDDGKEITFNLRRGVKFHSTPYFTPTRDFNADDVIFSFSRQSRGDHPWYDYNPGIYNSRISWEGFTNNQLNFLLVDIRHVDDYTVTFVLDRPFVPILANLAEEFASILSAEYAAQLEASNSKINLNTHPIGTGPFQFVAYQADTEIRYKLHPEHWNGVQAIDDLVFSITPKPTVRLVKMVAGMCHVAPHSPNSEHVELLRQIPNITILEQVGLNVSYLAYNTQDPPFDNANVRRALNMAINKQVIIDRVFPGGAVVAKNPIPPTLWSYDQNTQDEPYARSAARAILKREGVSILKLRVWAEDATDERRVAELIEAYFGGLNIEVKVIPYKRDDIDRLQIISRHGAVLTSSENNIADPSVFLDSLRCGTVGNSNLANWCNEEFEDLVARALRTNDMAERARLYESAQWIFKREAPWVTLFHELEFVPMSDKVIGYKVDPRGYHSFEGVDLLE